MERVTTGHNGSNDGERPKRGRIWMSQDFYSHTMRSRKCW